MRTNSISMASVGFGNKQKGASLSITPEEFASLNDKQLAKLSQTITKEQLNAKKQKRIHNALYYGLPVAAGIGTLALVPSSALRINKLGAALKTMGAWAVGILGVDLFFGAKRKALKSSEKLRNFENKHPIASSLATIGTVIAGTALAAFGCNKAAQKVLPKVMNKDFAKAAASKASTLWNKFGIALENSKILNGASKISEKTPSALKTVGKSVLANSVWIMLFANLAHSLNFSKKAISTSVRNAAELKNAQNQVREALAKTQEPEAAEV